MFGVGNQRCFIKVSHGESMPGKKGCCYTEGGGTVRSEACKDQEADLLEAKDRVEPNRACEPSKLFKLIFTEAKKTWSCLFPEV